MDSQSNNNHSSALIKLDNVVKIYPTTNGGFTALKGLNGEFFAGEYVGLLGKSGAGKTTLVNMITAVDHISKGTVYVKDVPIHDLSQNQAAVWRGKNLGVVYQNFRLMPGISLVDNIMMPIDFAGEYNPGLSVERALELLREMELEEHAFKHPNAISGGQQQRVAIARALANDPPIIIADEPTGRLDSATAEVIFSIFEKLVSRGKLVILATHDQSVFERFSRRILLVDGSIAEDSGRA